MGLHANGDLRVWGENSLGELGDNGASGDSSSTPTYSNVSKVKAISAGSFYSKHISSIGRMTACGDNTAQGLLADDTTIVRMSPVISNIENFEFKNKTAYKTALATSAGIFHAVSIQDNWKLAGVGNNVNGQLGTGDNVQTRIYNGDCTINCFVVPAAASATGPLVPQCDKSTYGLTGSTPPDDAFVVWRVIEGSGSLLGDSTVSPQDTSPSTGLNRYVYLIAVSGCGYNTDTVDVMVNDTKANAGENDSICFASAFNLKGNAAPTGSGNWNQVGGPVAVITTASDSLSPVVAMSSGSTNLFEWTMTETGCLITRDTVEIRVKAPPTTSNVVTGDATICGNTLTTICANTPSVGVGVWTLNSPTGSTLVDPDSICTDVNLKIALSTFYWTITNGPCPESVDSVKITGQNNTLAPNAGDDDSICVTQPNFQLSGNDPASFSGKWTSIISGSGTFDDDTNHDSIVSGYAVGNNYYEWELSNGVCTRADTVLLIVKQIPTTADAGMNDTVCVGPVLNNFLAGNTPSFGNGKWSVLFPATGTTVSNDNDPNSQVDLKVEGVVSQIEWSISTGQCPSSKDTVFLKGIGIDTAFAGLDDENCDTFRTMSGTAIASGFGSGTWSVVSGCGRINAINTPGTLVDSLCYGENVFVWNVTNGGQCASTDTVIIKVTEPDTLILERYDLNSNILSTNASGLSGIKWFVNDTLISGETLNDYTMTAPCGKYFVEAIDDNTGCKGISPHKDYCSVSIEEELLSFSQLIPNPTTGELRIIIDQSLKGHFSYSIYNSIGSLMAREYVIGYQKSIDISQYENGMYYVRMEQGDHQVIKKIVKY